MGMVRLAYGSCRPAVAATSDEQIDDGAAIEIATPRGLGVLEHRAMAGAQGHRQSRGLSEIDDQARIREFHS
jgi:hypothetical protein